MEPDAAVYVQRFRAEYLVPAQHPAPEQIKARLDEALEHDARALLAAMLAPLVSPSDPGVWLIRRLEVELNINAVLERDQIAQHWARQVTLRLDDAMADRDAENVAWFPDRAAHLAQFLSDLAAGNAWSNWWYEMFEGLRVLPLSAAARTALLDDPATGRAALLQLGARARPVLRALTVHDAGRVLHGLDPDGAGDPAGLLDGVLAAWRGRAPVPLDHEIHDALELYLDVCRGDGRVAGPALVQAVLAFVRLTRMGERAGRAAAAALANRDVAALYQSAGAGNAECLMPLLGAPASMLDALVANGSGHDGPPPETVRRRATLFGGVFYLLPALDELPLGDLVRDWPAIGPDPAEAVVRFLILARCLGGARAMRLFDDLLVRDLLAVSPSLSLDAVERWQRKIGPAQLDGFLRGLRDWQRAQGRVQDDTWLCCRVPGRGRPVALVLDAARGMWLDAGSYAPSRPEGFAARLAERWAHAAPQTLVVTDPSLGDALARAFAGTRVLRSDDVALAEQPHEGLHEVLLRVSQQGDDLAYLAPAGSLAQKRIHNSRRASEDRIGRLPHRLGVSSLLPAPGRCKHPLIRYESVFLDLALRVAAQGILRAFAWRLPGFARSGLPYLAANFLDFRASVETEAARHIVRLSRPPLHLVLQMNGMARGLYLLGWSGDTAFCLYPDDDHD